MNRFVIHASPGQAARAVAEFIADLLRVQPDLTVALPTGRTPRQLYRTLVALYRQKRADFRHATIFNLDEFLGLPRDDRRSYAAFLDRYLLSLVNVASDHVHLIDGSASDWRKEARRYETAILDARGLDLVIVGIGANGHIGFNEPAPALSARTHRVRLHRATRQANAAAFDGNWRRVPTMALTMGMGTILAARSVLLLATGRNKAEIVARALEGPVTTRVPASLLQLHPNAVIVLDRAAAQKLNRGATAGRAASER